MGRSYNQDSVVNFICTQSFCGLIPLNRNNYWVYEDSIFVDGVFSKVQLDTLQFSSITSVQDGLVWWKGSMNVGLPETIFANDSSIFNLTQRLFTPGYMDVKKEFGMFPGDSIRFLTNFDDYAAQGRGVKLYSEFQVESVGYSNVVYFEKNARNYRRDQIYLQPGLGVIKYIHEKANTGYPRVVKLQKISTLVSYHIQ